MHGVAESILRFVYPPRCASCDRAEQISPLFCAECDSKMAALQTAARCGKCSMPAAGPGLPCPHCKERGLPPFATVASLGVLGEPLKQVVHRGKYTGGWPMLELLTDRLAQMPQVRQLLSNTELIVPVPLHRRRQVERGYNQAEVIARRLGTLRQVPVHAAVVDRLRNTQVQSHLASRQKRVANLRDAFALRDGGPVTGRRVLLVDDVLTTGSTLVHLARVVQKAEPASLSAVVLAVADPRGREFEFV